MPIDPKATITITKWETMEIYQDECPEEETGEGMFHWEEYFADRDEM